MTKTVDIVESIDKIISSEVFIQNVKDNLALLSNNLLNNLVSKTLENGDLLFFLGSEESKVWFEMVFNNTGKMDIRCRNGNMGCEGSFQQFTIKD
jgi:hypothetical protein